MIIKLKQKKFFISLGSIALLSTSFLPRVNASNSLKINNEDNSFFESEKYYTLDQKKLLKNKYIIDKKINLLRDNLKNWEINKIPPKDITLINEIDNLLSDYGDPQGFCPLDNKKIDRNLEKIYSEYMLEIIKPIYALPRGQKLNEFGKNNLWIPSLDINDNDIAEEEIHLLKKLKPVFGYIYGDSENIYRGPISKDAALLANALIDRVLLKLKRSGNSELINEVSYRAIKASNLYWPIGNVNDAINEYKKAISLLEKDIDNELNNSALTNLYGSISYLYALKENFALMQDSLDKAFLTLSKLKTLDIQSLVETSIIPYWYGFHNERIDYNLLYKNYIKYLEVIGGPKSSSYLWAVSDYLWYLNAPIKNRIKISETIVDGMRNCSKGYDLAMMLEQKGWLENENGDYKSSLKTAEESLAQFVYGNGWENDETAKVLNLLATNQIAIGQYESAIKSLEKEIDIKKRLGFKNLYNPIEGSPLSKKHRICSVKQFKGCGSKSGIKLLNDLISYINTKFIYLSNDDRNQLFKNIKEDIIYRSYQNENLIEEHLSFWLSTKGILSDIEKSTNLILNANEGNLKYINEIKDITSRLADLTLEKSLRLKLLDKRNLLERDLFKSIPELNQKVITVEEIKEVLPEESALIEFQKYIPYDITNKNADENERYLAFLITNNKKVKKFDLGLAEIIDKKINLALESTQQGLKDSENNWNDVRDLIIKPIRKNITEYKTLFISPDGLINNVPFAALPKKGLFKNSYLGEEYNLTLLSTGRDLIELSKINTFKSTSPLVVSNPNFDTSKKDKDISLLDEINFANNASKRESYLNENWKSLPNSKKEGQLLSNLLNAKLLSQDEAKPKVIKSVSNPKVLHIASHYKLLDKEKDELANINPLMVGRIPLTGANALIKESKNDGYLTALDIAQMNLNGTELVTISGCESALGKTNIGEGNFGLKRAIAISGARSSLLSLWKVNDKMTSDFMISFYKKLKSGKSRSEALTLSQREFRNSSNPDYRHINSWGAFQLNGDWRKIDF